MPSSQTLSRPPEPCPWLPPIYPSKMTPKMTPEMTPEMTPSINPSINHHDHHHQPRVLRGGDTVEYIRILRRQQHVFGSFFIGNLSCFTENRWKKFCVATPFFDFFFGGNFLCIIFFNKFFNKFLCRVWTFCTRPLHKCAHRFIAIKIYCIFFSKKWSKFADFFPAKISKISGPKQTSYRWKLLNFLSWAIFPEKFFSIFLIKIYSILCNLLIIKNGSILPRVGYSFSKFGKIWDF